MNKSKIETLGFYTLFVVIMTTATLLWIAFWVLEGRMIPGSLPILILFWVAVAWYTRQIVIPSLCMELREEVAEEGQLKRMSREIAELREELRRSQ